MSEEPVGAFDKVDNQDIFDNMDSHAGAGLDNSLAVAMRAEKSRKENPRKWERLVVGPDELDDLINKGETVVFLGGACNYVDADGVEQRNVDRDNLISFLNENGVWVFDPQIHPDTHGREYKYSLDGDTEKKAIDYSKTDLIQIKPESFGGVSMLEALKDRNFTDGKRIIWMSGGVDEFRPSGLDGTGAAGESLKKECIKSGRALRGNFLDMFGMRDKEGNVVKTTNKEGNLDVFIGGDDSTLFGFRQQAEQNGIKVVEIGGGEIGGVKLLDVFDRVQRGEKIALAFVGGVDVKGNPVFVADGDLNKYKIEGDAMRLKMLDIMSKDENTKVVRSEELASYELRQILKIDKPMEVQAAA